LLDSSNQVSERPSASITTCVRADQGGKALRQLHPAGSALALKLDVGQIALAAAQLGSQI